MPKYYVAGIPFDSENALMHYGVKGMKWDKHIFGPDANTKYINWMDVGKLASSKRPSQFTDTASDRSASQGGALRTSSQQKGPGLVRSALDKGAQLRYKANQAVNQAGKAIGSAATSAARAAGGALNASSNFLTGNQSRSNLSDAQRSYDYNKKQMVNNARLYNQGKANLANATNLTNEASQRYVNASTGDNPNPDALNNLTNDLNRATEIANTANEQMQTSTNRKNDILDKTLAARENLNQAQNAYDNTLPGIASRAGQGAKGFINSAGKWVSNAAGDVGKAATNAWNGVTGWLGGAAKDVGKAASDAAGWVGDRADDVGKAATNAWNGVTGAANQAGDWIGDRASDVGKAATNAWEGAKGAAGDVRDFFVGNPDQQNASRMMRNPERSNQGGILGAAGDWIGDRAQDVGNAANQAWNGVSGAASQAGQWIGDTAQKAWESPWVNPVKAINVAGDWIGDRAGDVGRAATTAWNGVRGAANTIGDWFSDGSDKRQALGEAIRNDNMLSGISREFVKENYPNEYDKLVNDQNSAKEARSKAVEDYMNFSNNPVNTVAREFNLPNAKGNWAYAVPGNEQYLDKFNEAWIPKTENISDWFTGNNYKKEADKRSDWANEWDRKADEVDSYGLPSIAQDARDYASKDREYENALRNMYNNAPQQKISNFASNAWNGVTGAANSVGDWAGNAARDVGNAAGSTMKALENAYGDASKWVVDNAGTVRDAVTGAALGTADWAVQQYKNLFHSAIDDKPDGVTDTFWKNYVASGGTREQYERDWR